MSHGQDRIPSAMLSRLIASPKSDKYLEQAPLCNLVKINSSMALALSAGRLPLAAGRTSVEPFRSCRAGAGLWRPIGLNRFASIRAAAGDDTDIGTVGTAAAALGLVANPIVLVSEYVLKTTGSGLPPGPGGLYGAAEGISYLVVVGIVAWSLKTKVQTGSGLPAGPNGLLGAAEGLSYFSLLAGIVIGIAHWLCGGAGAGIIVAGLTIADKGSLPGVLG